VAVRKHEKRAESDVKFDPNMLRNVMKQLKMEEIPATEVVIKTSSGNIIVSNPSVQKMNMQGKDMFQISGDISNEETIEVSEDDIKMVMDQTGCSEDSAIDALGKSNGDLAGAILLLKK